MVLIFKLTYLAKLLISSIFLGLINLSFLNSFKLIIFNKKFEISVNLISFLKIF